MANRPSVYDNQFFNAGVPAAGFKLYTYDSGTTTPKATYTDQAGTIPNTNPITLDADGMCELWLGAGEYTLALYTGLIGSGGALVKSWDDVSGASTQAELDTLRADLASTTDAAKGSNLISFIAAGIGAAWRTVRDKLRGFVDVEDYGAVGGDTGDQSAAIMAAMTAAGNGGEIRFKPNTTYRCTGPVTASVTAQRLTFKGRGATLNFAHTGDGLVLTATNQNYGGHTVEDLVIQGPNVSYPQSAAELAGTSNGAGIKIGDVSDTSNAAVGYGVTLRNVTIQGFKHGRYIRAGLLMSMFGGSIRFNQYGDYWDGGQSNGNHSWGVRIRENRVAGVWSSGATGGSLTNSTSNGYHGCIFETNIPYRGDNPAGYSGGYPTAMDTSGTVGVGVYLYNTYDWIFDSSCYWENQNYSIVFAGSSDQNSVAHCRLDGGGNRVGGVRFIGASAINNEISHCHKNCLTTTEANLVTDHADHARNQILDCSGFNLIAANLVGVPFVRNNVASQAGGGSVHGVMGIPTQAVVTDVTEGTTPGFMTGVGTATANLKAQGFASMVFGSGGVGAAGTNTTITVIDVGVMRNCYLMLRNYQVARTVTIKHDAATGPIVMKAGVDKVLSTYNSQVLFWITEVGHCVEV